MTLPQIMWSNKKRISLEGFIKIRNYSMRPSMAFIVNCTKTEVVRLLVLQNKSLLTSFRLWSFRIVFISIGTINNPSYNIYEHEHLFFLAFSVMNRARIIYRSSTSFIFLHACAAADSPSNVDDIIYPDTGNAILWYRNITYCCF